MMDLFVLSANWKAMTGPQYGDLDGNGTVGPEDLLALLADWHSTFPTITIDIPGFPPDARPLRLIRIPARTFQMGSPVTVRGRYYDYEGPVHTVNITNGFYIGEVHEGEMRLSEFGIIVRDLWYEIPDRYPRVRLDAFVVMPNHLHGILLIQPEDACDSEVESGTPVGEIHEFPLRRGESELPRCARAEKPS